MVILIIKGSLSFENIEKPLLWILKYNLIRNKDMSSGVHKLDDAALTSLS